MMFILLLLEHNVG